MIFGVRIDEVRRNGVLYTLRCTMSAIIEWNVAEDWNSRNCNPEGFTSKNTLDKANPSGFAPSEARMRLAEIINLGRGLRKFFGVVVAGGGSLSS